jgi:hypothetical protein
MFNEIGPSHAMSFPGPKAGQLQTGAQVFNRKSQAFHSKISRVEHKRTASIHNWLYAQKNTWGKKKKRGKKGDQKFLGLSLGAKEARWRELRDES